MPPGNASAVLSDPLSQPSLLSSQCCGQYPHHAHAKRIFWVAASSDLHTGHYFLTSFPVLESCECQLKGNPSDTP